MVRTLWAAAAVSMVALAGVSPAKATIVDNSPLIAPPGVFFGTGNVNSNFTIDNDNGIQIGESAITRFVGPIVPASSNIYDVPLGATTVAGKTGAAWGVTFSINLQPGGVGTLTLGNITASWTLTDIGTGKTGSFNPLLIPDNSVSAAAVQNSEALSFTSIAQAFGDVDGSNNSLFNLNANDTYIFTLDVTEVGGPLLASDVIVVEAGTGAPVPEPESLALLGTGLLGLIAIRRRRKS